MNSVSLKPNSTIIGLSIACPIATAQELAERPDQGSLQPLAGALPRRFVAQHLVVQPRPHPQGGDHSRENAQPGETVRHPPAEPEPFRRGERDRPHAGEERPEAVAELVVRGAVGELILGQDLDAIGIDDDVLRRAEKRGHDRPEGEHPEMQLGPA
jgi:hypothetical protein